MKKKTDIWMPLYIGDYLADTAHLSAMESGAYLHLLMHSWKTGPLPSEQEMLRRIARVDSSAWSNAWSILQAFFTHNEDGSWTQARLEKERHSWNEKKSAATEKARNAAKARHDSASSMLQATVEQSSSSTQAMLGSCPSPSPLSLPKNFNPTAKDLAEMVTKKVMQEAPLSGMQVRMAIETVALSELRSGLDWESVAEAMLGAWREFSGSRSRLEFAWGAEKFFGEGNWKDKTAWPWKTGQTPKPVRRYME